MCIVYFGSEVEYPMTMILQVDRCGSSPNPGKRLAMFSCSLIYMFYVSNGSSWSGLLADKNVRSKSRLACQQDGKIPEICLTWTPPAGLHARLSPLVAEYVRL